MQFSGKVAIVTGATRGIGLACARELARGGARIVVNSRKSEACETTAEMLRKNGCEAIAVPGHAARDEDLANMVAQTLSFFGRLDIAVANVSINPTFDELTDLEEASWTKVIDTNLSGTWRLARHTLPAMTAPGGAFVAISSINAIRAIPGSGVYGISKAAVEHLVRQLAVEWGPRGVRVNAVSPGTTDTDMIRKLMDRPGFSDLILRSTPLGRIARPEDIAGAVAFMASDAAAHVTGQCLVVDGGQTIMRGEYGDSRAPADE